MRLLRLTFLASILIPAAASAAESLTFSGLPYVSLENSRERALEVEKQEALIRQQEQQSQESDIEPQDMVRSPKDLQQHLLNQQSTYNPQQQPSSDQQRALGQAMQNYYKVLRDNNIDPDMAKLAYPEPQASYPPKPGSSYYDPNANYDPAAHFVPNMNNMPDTQ